MTSRTALLMVYGEWLLRREGPRRLSSAWFKVRTGQPGRSPT